MNCLHDGRNSAAAYFNSLAISDADRSEVYRRIAEAFAECARAIGEMRNLYGYDMDVNLQNIADRSIRKQDLRAVRTRKARRHESTGFDEGIVCLRRHKSDNG